MTPAYILSLLQGVQEELFFGAVLDSEMASDALSTEIHAIRMDGLIQRRLKSEHAISSFASLVLEDTRAIREAVNSGEVPFTEVLHLVDASAEFREWLGAQPTDVDLVRAYYQEVIKKTWAEKLPAKTT